MVPSTRSSAISLIGVGCDSPTRASSARRLSVRVGRAALREIATIATRDTLLRWHRQLIAPKWTYARKAGRREVLVEIRARVVRMATENRTWGLHPHLS